MMVAPKRKTSDDSDERAPPVARNGGNDTLPETLAQAAWEQADDALAQALIEFEVAVNAKSARTRAEALALLGQALARAARRRGLSRLGTIGRRELFDPARHELTRAAAKPPKAVRIVARGVSRAGDVLARAQVVPERAP